MRQTRAIIADDETPLRDHLGTLLTKLWPELVIVGTAVNGAEAVSLIREQTPDIAFLDIKMPVFTGLQVAVQCGDDCDYVFVTAYDDYAVEAFDREAVDYLLKPVEQTRLKKTIARLKAKIDNSDSRSRDWTRMERLITSKIDNSRPNEYLHWIRTARKNEVYLLSVDDVAYFKAGDKYTSVFTQDEEFLIRRSLKELESELDPNHFWRVHRGVIVNVNYIDVTARSLDGRYTLKIKHREQTLPVSRNYSYKFRQM